ncbi:MAG: CBS domain-containing protein [Chloroflexi bacterium]|nr:CBS domain-containing protein [Chloroflexota bacterium]MBP8059311.1 CBS domain-containing protein [Chloroflexota bacterium]
MKVQLILATKVKGVITITPEKTLKDAAALLAQHRIGVLIVLNETGQISGILSERDIIREAAHNDQVLSQTVSHVMTQNVITGTPDDDIYSVAHLMTERRFRHLPILDEGQLVGLISIGDIMKAQRDAYRGEVNTLEMQLLADET